MKYSNKFVILILICCMAPCAMSQSRVEDSKVASENVIVFGKSFSQRKTITGNLYLDYITPEESITVKSTKFKNLDFANSLIKDRMALFYSVFDLKRVDYPGQYSKTISCPEELKPKLVRNDIDQGYLTYYDGYSNKNKITGACVQDLVEYKFVYGFLVCTSSSVLYEFEHYSSLNSLTFQSFLSMLKCV